LWWSRRSGGVDSPRSGRHGCTRDRLKAFCKDDVALRDWVAQMEEEGHKLFAVDCEWHGKNYLDGKLRTIQFAWSESDAVVIEFRDENNWFTFQIENEGGVGPFGPSAFSVTITRAGFGTQTHIDEEITDEDEAEQAVRDIAEFAATPEWIKEKNAKALAEAKRAAHGPIEDDLPEAYEKKKYAYIGSILGQLLNKPGVEYIGHHFSADAPWMQYWLGLETNERCYMDTEFAQQTADESSVLSLERGIAMKYTTLGLYNLDLALWKREHKQLWSNGYGYVPSEILIPYSAKDVIAPFRAAPRIRNMLESQGLWHYYKKILNPFVTDVFTAFHMHGLPTDVALLDELRELYHFAKERLDVQFKLRVAGEAKAKLLEKLLELPDAPLHLFQQMCDVGDPQSALDLIKPYLDPSDMLFWSKLCQHLYDAPNFNIRSPDQMRTWLFDVHNLTPIKSTNQKAKGLPSMAWDKVLELPEDRQRLYTPAVDKQTLQILSEEFDTLDELLNLNAVGNVCKAFLKQAEEYVDDNGNTVTEEQGILAWVCSDLRIRYNMSCTETSRSRTWQPNVLED
jgi:DNA polymerase I-like protein with 3'-5' exonuclease and polymerase domains